MSGAAGAVGRARDVLARDMCAAKAQSATGPANLSRVERRAAVLRGPVAEQAPPQPSAAAVVLLSGSGFFTAAVAAESVAVKSSSARAGS